MITIQGKVITGRQDGRKIGFPTANIDVDYSRFPMESVQPGIYAAKIKVHGKWHDTATYYGKALTYNFDTVVLESHILDFNQEIYGEIVDLKLLEFVRPVVKFESLESLKKQIDLDCIKCQQICSKIQNL
jgi:riboflavin kinase / FMN adenylyltransferase